MDSKKMVIVSLVLLLLVFSCATVSAFDFVKWLKEVLGITETAAEEVSYIPLEEIAKEETPKNESLDISTTTETKEELGEAVKSGEKPIVIIVKETALVSLIPKVDDPDKDKITYTFTSPLNENGEWQTTYGDAGEYTVTVTASDGSLTSVRDALVVVNKREEAPTIQSSVPLATTVEADEGSTIDLEVKAIDLNKDEIAYVWKLDGNEVSKAASYKYEVGFNEAGSHTVKVAVSDGKGETAQIWSVKVNNINRPPVLEAIAPINIKEGEKLQITPKAADPDGDKITIKIADPIGDDRVWDIAFDAAGEYSIKITASDGIDEVSDTLKVSVENVNRPPVIVDITQK